MIGTRLVPAVALALSAQLAGCAARAPSPVPAPPAPAAVTAGLLTLADGRERRVAPQALTVTGQARYLWPDGSRYDGRWRNGQPEGQGTFTWPDGRRYQGNFAAGRFQGRGTLREAGGDSYSGEWAAGQREGQGESTDATGQYSGGWRADRRHGDGIFRGADGSRYQGQYIDGLRHGSGTLDRADGSQYAGDWLADTPNGFGVLSWPDGRRREGQWRDGMSEGYGTFAHPAGLRFEGNWQADARTGYGAEQRPDGSRYEGEWARDLPEGAGSMRFADGRRHEGEWQAGEPRGPGIRTSPAGYSLAGDWQAGALQSGTLKLTGLLPYEGPLFGTEGQLAPAAAAWLTGHAGTGNSAAAFLLAARGPDAQARNGYLLQAANGDVAAAQLMLGTQLLAEDTRAALTWLQRAAGHDAQPQPVAHFLLGQLYHLGTDLPQDEDQAEDHYLRAIALGSISARRNLALMLATTSISYLRDPERAIAILAPVARYYNDPELLDALAAVFDAAGRSTDAEAARQAAGHARQPEPQPP